MSRVLVEFSVKRNRKMVADQIARGLIQGALLGPGLSVEGRDGESIRFRRALPARLGIPDQGSIQFTAGDGGSVGLSFQLEYRGFRLWIASRAIFWAGLAATIFALAFGWLITVSVPVAAAVGAAGDILSWRRERASIRSRIETFVHNTRYLESL